MPKVCVVLTARPSYAKWKTILEALRAMPDVELQIIVAASANLERYGRVRDVLSQDKFHIDAECWTVLEGETLLTGARETGLAMMDLASAYHRLQPGIVCVMADRREILAAAAAAKMQHIALAHCQGGERSGSVDDTIRDSVTMLADYHFTCTERARFRVYSLTGAHERIWKTGCSSIDVAKRALEEPPVTNEELSGSGPSLDLDHPFQFVLQHSATNEADHAYEQMWLTLDACRRVPLPRVVGWPGEDAGSTGVSKAIRVFRERYPHEIIRTVRNLPPNRFLRLLTQAAVAVGNSSAFVREGAYLGIPAVVVGTRQLGRERGSNVIDVPHDVDAIAAAIRRQIGHGRHASSPLYGTGDAGQRIADVLVQIAKAQGGASSVDSRQSPACSREPCAPAQRAICERSRIPRAISSREARVGKA